MKTEKIINPTNDSYPLLALLPKGFMFYENNIIIKELKGKEKSIIVELNLELFKNERVLQNITRYSMLKDKSQVEKIFNEEDIEEIFFWLKTLLCRLEISTTLGKTSTKFM